MNKKVNWGIIGLGNAAMNFAKASQLTENAILKGISSKNQKKYSKGRFCSAFRTRLFFKGASGRVFGGLGDDFGRIWG